MFHLNNLNLIKAIGFAGVLFSMASGGCRHELATNTPVDPIDTTGNPIDTVSQNIGIPCNPDTVYFENDVLPILVSNCARPECHDAVNPEEGIRLYSYQTYISTIKNPTSTDANKNELLEVIFEDNPDKRMPPPPNAPLSLADIALIQKWLQQGAINNHCNENYGGCATVNVSWMAFVKPLVDTKCKGCHNSTNANGGIKLTSYSEVKAIALSGQFYQAISRTTNWMPKGGQKLDNCTAEKIKSWVIAGAPEN